MIAIDTNVLVYAHRAETDLHEMALDHLTSLCEGNQPWALPVPCLTEFFRVVTHPKVFTPPLPGLLTQLTLPDRSQMHRRAGC